MPAACASGNDATGAVWCDECATCAAGMRVGADGVRTADSSGSVLTGERLAAALQYQLTEIERKPQIDFDNVKHLIGKFTWPKVFDRVEQIYIQTAPASGADFSAL